MSIEIRPQGITCNLNCKYCYESKSREVSGRSYRYDREAVLASINKLGPKDHFSLFGGEALLLNLTDLEELLRLAYERSGSSGVQTNGVLITDAHVELFRKYRTQVGISIDGPGDLNDVRWVGTLEATREATAKTQANLETLAGLAKTCPHLMPSLIVTLHAGNASPDKFSRFLDWLHHLDSLGIKHLNLHVMELDHEAGDWALPEEETADRLIDIWNQQESFTQLRCDLFTEVMKLLHGKDDVVCIWRACDPWNTNAVQGIEHDGAPSHCSRTNKDGVNWLPAEGLGTSTNFIGFSGAQHYERQMALYQAPQEFGGCKGCCYWLMCMGNCPGTGLDGDWRKRSSYCYVYQRLFKEGLRRMKAAQDTEVPLPLWPNRQELEEKVFRLWASHQCGSLNRSL